MERLAEGSILRGLCRKSQGLIKEEYDGESRIVWIAATPPEIF
jgi:hypothetical protein